MTSTFASTSSAQGPDGEADKAARKQPAPDDFDLAPAQPSVTVTQLASDEEIDKRLQSVLEATGWFTEPVVRVDEGVVFLSGRADSLELKTWAGDLARKTQDVVAVVNLMEVPEPSVWDLGPARLGLMALWRDFLRSLPLFALGLVILTLSAGAGIAARRGARAFLRRRIRANLLRNVLALGAGVLVFLFGTYIVLRISGLTQLALTVIGGTGLIGLAFGIAFRDITENFLASIFLSVQQPFQTDDLVEVAGVIGYVQQLNVRTTILMMLCGNLVQIPNATVYKSNLRNFTANANRREDFIVGIGYEDSINDAQEVARKVLAEHPAVLEDPEPSVLADSLGTATVNLRVYFWLNGREHSWLKVRSSVIRLVKRAFQQHGISMPDEAREVVFPQGIPVTILGDQDDRVAIQTEARRSAESPGEDVDSPATKAEGGLVSEAGLIQEQAQGVQPLKDGQNLLTVTSASPSVEEVARNERVERKKSAT